jgi:hypothetical protein
LQHKELREEMEEVGRERAKEFEIGSVSKRMFRIVDWG